MSRDARRSDGNSVARLRYRPLQRVMAGAVAVAFLCTNVVVVPSAAAAAMTTSAGSLAVPEVDEDKVKDASPPISAGWAQHGATRGAFAVDDNLDGQDALMSREGGNSQGYPLLSLPGYEPGKVGNPSATVPVQGTVLGHTPGEFRVSSNGSAQYSIPLPVPPGRGGFQPSVAIEYHSGGGNSPLGVGFSVSAASAIARCAATLAEDHAVRGVKLDQYDRFCLGGRKLVAVKGVYGAHGTEYRTLPDTQVRVVSYGGTPATGPSHFVGNLPNGQTQHYGRDPWNHEDVSAVRVGAELVNVSWPLLMAEDGAKNPIAYRYEKRTSNNGSELERVLASIYYGGFTGGAADRHVQFSYQSRPDPSFGFQHGSAREATQRLYAIRTFVKGYTVEGAWKRARSYDLAYENNGITGRSKLVSITECGVDAQACLQPTTFKWAPGNDTYSGSYAQTFPLPADKDTMLVTADFDGDGKTDVAYPALTKWKFVYANADLYNPYSSAIDATGGEPPIAGTRSTAYLIDWDLDSRLDLLAREAFENDAWKGLLTRGANGQVKVLDTSFTGPLNQGSTGNGYQNKGAIFGDLDGDGLQDMLEHQPSLTESGKYDWHYRRRTGRVRLTEKPNNVVFEDSAFTQTLKNPITDKLSPFGPSKVLVFDVDGDGIEDIITPISPFEGPQSDLVVHDMKYHVSKVVPNLKRYLLDVDVKLADVNGDGLVDIVANKPDGTSTTGQIFVHLNTGRGFLAAQDSGLWTKGWKAARVFDFNLDGKADFLVPRTSGTQTTFVGVDVAIAGQDAQGKLVFTKKPLLDFDTPMSLPQLVAQGVRVVDIHGDGDDDLLYLRSDGQQGVKRLDRRNEGGRPDVVVQLHDGSHVPADGSTANRTTVKIQYSTLSDPQVYDTGNCGFVEFMGCVGPSSQPVVKTVERDGGVNGNHDTIVSKYFYVEGRIDRKTGGFAGFAEMRVSTQAYQQIYPQGNAATLRSFYVNNVAGEPAQLQEQWSYTLNDDDEFVLERSRFQWKRVVSSGTVVPSAVTYFDHVQRLERRTYEFVQNSSCPWEGGCLDKLSRTMIDAYAGVPYRKTVQDHEVDLFNNVTRALTTYGDSGTDSTEVITEPAIDTASWLVKRPRLVKTIDRSHDGKLQLSGTRTMEYTYHTEPGKCHVIKQIKSYGATATGSDVRTIDHEYYPDGQPSLITRTDVTTGQKRQTAFAYDPFGLPHAVKNAKGQTASIGHDPLLGRLKVAVDINGLRTDHTYDTLGRLVQTQLPTGLVRTIAYKAEDRNLDKLSVIETSDPSSAVTQTVIDVAGRPLFERSKGFDGKMREKKNFYYVHGWLLATTSYKRQGSSESTDTIQRSYDSLGRLIRQKEPGGSERLWSYDKLTVTETDTRKNTTVAVADHRGRVVTVTDATNLPAEAVTREYGYAPFGKLSRTHVKGVANSESNFGYSNGVLSDTIDAERGYKHFHHNAFGELVRRQEGQDMARKTEFAYDELGRWTTRTVSEGGTLRSVVTNTYDESIGAGARKTAGALLRSQLTDYVAGGATHVTDFWFNGLAQLWMTDHTLPSESMPGATETLRITRSYDWLGRPDFVAYPMLQGQNAATKVVYEYAPAATSNGRLQRLKAIENLQGQGLKDTVLWTALDADQQDRLVHFMAGSVHTQSTFDWRGKTTSTLLRNDGYDDEWSDRIQAMLRFGYDSEGNLVSRSDDLQGVTETFAYDPLNRLKASSTQSADPLNVPDDVFAYDKLGNLVFSRRRGTYVVDPDKPTQVLKIFGGVVDGGSTRNYGYDALGQQVLRPEGKIVYNDFSLPARFTDAAGTSVKASFLYDATGIRARKLAAGETVTYVPGLYERHTKAGTNKVEHRLLVPLAGATLRYQHTGSTLSKLPTFYTHGDHMGSTTLVTQNDFEAVGGLLTTVVENRSYESFGLRRNPDWKASDVFGGLQPAALDQGFTGHDEDFELGTINMKGRIYDPQSGRFLTPDPNVDGANPTQRWNRYAYVSNAPLTFNDPTGFRFNLARERAEWWKGSMPFKGSLATQFLGADTPFLNTMLQQADAYFARQHQMVDVRAHMAADLKDRLELACNAGCSAAEKDFILRQWANDWKVPLKHDRKPSIDDVTNGHVKSGCHYADCYAQQEEKKDPSTAADVKGRLTPDQRTAIMVADADCRNNGRCWHLWMGDHWSDDPSAPEEAESLRERDQYMKEHAAAQSSSSTLSFPTAALFGAATAFVSEALHQTGRSLLELELGSVLGNATSKGVTGVAVGLTIWLFNNLVQPPKHPVVPTGRLGNPEATP